MKLAIAVLLLAVGCTAKEPRTAKSYTIVDANPPVGARCSAVCGDDVISCTRHTGLDGGLASLCWYADERGTRWTP